MKTLRARLLAKDVLIGTFCTIPHAGMVEMVAAAGWDFLVIDAEHTQIDRGNLEHLIRAAQVAHTPALLRVPHNDRVWIASALDAGAAGIVVPSVNTANEARAAIAATRYAPLGQRGAGPGRASAYGMNIEETVASDNVNVILAIQLETAEGLANIEDIAAVDGIDAIYIGPGDLALSLGAFGPDGRPVLDRAIAKIVECCRRHGRAVGIFNMTADNLHESIGRGMTFLTLAADSVFLSKGVHEAAEVARKVRAGA